MAQIIEIKTNQLVHEFIWIFNNKEDIEIIREIDSTNYGVGFDLTAKNIACRVYDESTTYSTESKNEDPCLKIEIDRLNKFTLSEQIVVLNYLKGIIRQSGFVVI